MTVKTFAIKSGLWSQILRALDEQLDRRAAKELLLELESVPVHRSRAVRRLGCYVSRLGKPVCIRLQFAQEAELLAETFLHEVAHACDHLSRKGRGKYSRAHGPQWCRWALALGIEPQVTGRSEQLDSLYAERLKVVAVCSRCGFELRRLRRLNRRGKYLHRECGGRLKPV
ncbi:SprT-like family protein [Malonomonas rubra DSM 5091]|uniref:SprT-like family protein n=1 Tax=Malonomonas rubra DSM 5091 TaxID=1122189 RepID=A0A1M6FHZ1_MALRU|nr:SprT-like domain-containing protein [Malonomonas rubra]SHI97334.1 SprT-like family protein [Malonomonas rubra DSM 5091]